MSSGADAQVNRRTVIVGTHVVEGYAKGPAVQVVQPERVSLQEGTDGHSMFKTNAYRSAVVTLVILASSESNDVLSSIMIAGLPVPVQVKDGNGRTLISSPRGKLTKFSDIAWTDGDETNTWALVCSDCTTFVGGMPGATINPDA